MFKIPPKIDSVDNIMPAIISMIKSPQKIK